LAAKGATPLGFLLAIALPKGFSEDWLARFAQGLGADAQAYQCPLLGGDTDSTPGPISISVAAFGVVPHGTMVRRAGAKAGDRFYVTGTIGDAALGLRARKGEAASWKLDAAMRDHLLSRFHLPHPRNALAGAVRAYASAAMDVSDGLAADLTKLCRASQVAADVEVARVPLSAAARQALAADAALIEPILTGGEDYEILCTVPEASISAFRQAAAAAAVPVSEIGRCVAGEGPRFLDASGKPLGFSRPGYSHF
jgi:thiamine-monophosphate kinase